MKNKLYNRIIALCALIAFLVVMGCTNPVTNQLNSLQSSLETEVKADSESRTARINTVILTVELEDATIKSGKVESKNSGYSGTGYANTDNKKDMYVEFPVNLTSAGSYTLDFRYALSSGNRYGSIQVNGSTVVSQIDFNSTGSWDQWANSSAAVNLNAGANTIRVTAEQSGGLPNMDKVDIIGDDENPQSSSSSSVSSSSSSSSSTSSAASSTSSSSSSTSDGKMLPQKGNPVHVRFDKYKQWAATQNQADIILSYQYDNGGFPKNVSYTKKGSGGSGKGTIDNGATTCEITYLAHVYHVLGDAKYLTAAQKGIDFLFNMQYPEGGFPQFYPLRGGYSDHVTFNDDAMSRVMVLLDKANKKEYPFNGSILTSSQRSKLQDALDRGVDYILKAQWKQKGKLTVWCAQHGKSDYLPKKARAYELPSLSGSESVEVLGFLMTQPQTPEIEKAVKAAVNWFRSPDSYLMDYTYDKSKDNPIVYKKGSKMWYRFYDLETNRGFFSDRDSRKVYDIMEISSERRSGYRWGGDYGEKIIPYAESVGY